MIDRNEAEKAGFKTGDSGAAAAERKQAKLEQLRSLLPGLVNNDGQLDTDTLKEELGIERYAPPNQGYGLDFAGKGLARIKADEPTTKELQVVRQQSKDFDNTGNVIIRGDNLDALKILQQSYAGKIKMIYIDPPYNTDSANFIYNDSFKQTEAELIEKYALDEDAVMFFENMFGTLTHSGWLFAMYPRLKLMRDLLAEDGVVFISIDDNEQANLKILCDEIFGENNFLATLHVQMSATQGMKVKAAKRGKIVKNAEYVLVYSKDEIKAAAEHPLYDPADYDPHYNKFLLEQTDGVYEEASLVDVAQRDNELMSELIALNIAKKGTKSFDTQEAYRLSSLFKEFTHSNADSIVRDHDIIDLPESFRREIHDEHVRIYQAEDRKYLVAKSGNGKFFQRISLREKINKADNFHSTYGVTTIRGNWWSGYYLDMGNISKEGDVAYENGKKPIRLIKSFLKMLGKQDALVLDFFAGSGTTAHAIMDMNKEDGGSRRFILVQWDEAIDPKKSKGAYDFCKQHGLEPVISSICIERVNRAGEKIKQEAGLLENGLDIGYKVFSLVGRPDIEERDGQLQLVSHRQSAEDTLYSMMAASGEVLLTDPIEEIETDKVYKVRGSYFVLGPCKTNLRKLSDKRVYINGFADFTMLQWLNALGLEKDLVKILY